MASNSICLRLKREHQTFFISASKSKSILYIKEEVSKAMNGQVKADKMRIYLPDEQDDGNTVLPDSALLSDHETIQNNSILYVVFRKKGMEDAAGADEFGELENVWEKVNVLKGEEES